MTDDSTLLACSLLAVWFVGLLLATPLYKPYPRLTLPLLMSTWLGMGASLSWTLRSKASVEPQFANSARRTIGYGNWLLVGVSLLILGYCVFGPSRLSLQHTVAWQSRDGLRVVANQVLADVERIAEQEGQQDMHGIRFILYVYAEPALYYHLSAADVVAQPVGNLDFIHPNAPPRILPTFLVSGPHAHRSPEFEEQMRMVDDKFEFVDEYDYLPSDLVLLNEYHPDRFPKKLLQQIRLYRAH